MPSFISGANITDLCSELSKNSVIDPKLYEKYHVKKGLRNSDGTGVVAGIKNICNVHVPLPGKEMILVTRIVYHKNAGLKSQRERRA